ncbi:hypothetical protein M8494_28315 [Serratia ureilytica]
MEVPGAHYIPNWLKLANEGRIMEAADLAHQTNSLPEVCGRVPAGSPVRRLLHPERRIRRGHHRYIERYISDKAIEMGWKRTCHTCSRPASAWRSSAPAPPGWPAPTC